MYRFKKVLLIVGGAFLILLAGYGIFKIQDKKNSTSKLEASTFIGTGEIQQNDVTNKSVVILIKTGKNAIEDGVGTSVKFSYDTKTVLQKENSDAISINELTEKSLVTITGERQGKNYYINSLRVIPAQTAQ